MIFQENNKALKLKYAQYIPALSVRLEGDPVSEIVTRYEEKLQFLILPLWRRSCLGTDLQPLLDFVSSVFLCAQEISFQLSWNTAIS